MTLGRTAVLNDLDLELGAGVHGLLGPNGAGKTTLIRVLATTLRHDRGTVEILGLPLQRAKNTRWVRNGSAIRRRASATTPASPSGSTSGTWPG